MYGFRPLSITLPWGTPETRTTKSSYRRGHTPSELVPPFLRPTGTAEFSHCDLCSIVEYSIS